MDHQQLKDLLALAALDQLEPEEEHLLQAHLAAGCSECEAELGGFREAAAALALGSTSTGIEQRVWERLQVRLAESAADQRAPMAPARAAAAHPLAGRARGWRLVSGALAAALVGLAIYAGILTNRLQRSETKNRQLMLTLNSQTQALSAQLASARAQVNALQSVLASRAQLDRVLMSPDLRLIRLQPLKEAPGAQGIVVLSPTNHAAVIQVSGLPPTLPGKAYELWWITKESGPVPAGLFRVQGPGSVLSAASPPPPGQQVVLSAVTLEPSSGVSKPTGAMYLKGAPAS